MLHVAESALASSDGGSDALDVLGPVPGSHCSVMPGNVCVRKSPQNGPPGLTWPVHVALQREQNGLP